MKKVITTILLASVMAMTISGTGIAADQSLYKRLAGANRIETAIAVSEEKGQVNGTVFITNANNFADALASAPLVHSMNKGTVLLVNTEALNPEVKVEILKRTPTSIVIIGGTGAISSDVEASLKLLCSNTVRIAGADRYKTAIAIGNAFNTTLSSDKLETVIKNDAIQHETVYLAFGENYPDALAASTFAARQQAPILFTSGTTLNTDSMSAIKKWNTEKVYILGGEGVIPAGVVTSLQSAGITVERLGGKDRYETAMTIVDKLWDKANDIGLTLCTGEGYADALASTSLADEKNMPVMLVNSTTSETVKDFIRSKNSKGYIIGGEGILSDELMQNIRNPIKFVLPNEFDIPAYESIEIWNIQDGEFSNFKDENGNAIIGKKWAFEENGFTGGELVMNLENIKSENNGIPTYGYTGTTTDKYLSNKLNGAYDNTILPTEYCSNVNKMVFGITVSMSLSAFQEISNNITPYYTPNLNRVSIGTSTDLAPLNPKILDTMLVNIYTKDTPLNKKDYASIYLNIKNKEDAIKYMTTVGLTVKTLIPTIDAEAVYNAIVESMMSAEYNKDYSGYELKGDEYIKTVNFASIAMTIGVSESNGINFSFVKK